MKNFKKLREEALRQQQRQAEVFKEGDAVMSARTGDKGYKITTPEGYVLHKDGDMIKFVNRLEFAYNNFTLQQQWR